jgi:Predicted dehydrogenases and related proteins
MEAGDTVGAAARSVQRERRSRMSDPIRWGIAGPGFIATLFTRDLARIPDEARIVAVGTSRRGGADAFAAEFGVDRVHESYAALAADPEVEVVYVATPHARHLATAMTAIEAGKHVLIEKPLALNEREAAMLVQAARANGVFLMEAMWTRFLPHIAKIHELIADGALGDIVQVFAEQGIWFDPEHPEHRLYDRALGGGALLDLGVYAVSFALSLLGAPDRIVSTAALTDTGVDGQTTAILQYDSGAQAITTSTLAAWTRTGAVVAGTKARIELEPRWMMPVPFALITRDGERTDFANDYPGHGLREEAREVARCVRAGLLESPFMPHDFSLLTMRTMDRIREQIGLRYEADR